MFFIPHGNDKWPINDSHAKKSSAINHVPIASTQCHDSGSV